MMDCPFNKGFSAEKCPIQTDSLEWLLDHVRSGHGAIAWGKATLEKALKEARP